MINISDLDLNSNVWGGLAKHTRYKWEFSDPKPEERPVHRFDLEPENEIKVELKVQTPPCFGRFKFELDSGDICP